MAHLRAWELTQRVHLSPQPCLCLSAITMAAAGHAASLVHEVDLQDAAAVHLAMLTIAQVHWYGCTAPWPTAKRVGQQRCRHRGAATMPRPRAPLLQALADDGVSLYLSKPGSEQSFLLAEMAEHLEDGQQLFLSLSDYRCGQAGPACGMLGYASPCCPLICLAATLCSCCALIGELCRQGYPPSWIQGSADASCRAAAAARTAVEQLARSDRLDGVARLHEQPVLHRLVEVGACQFMHSTVQRPP